MKRPFVFVLFVLHSVGVLANICSDMSYENCQPCAVSCSSNGREMIATSTPPKLIATVPMPSGHTVRLERLRATLRSQIGEFPVAQVSVRLDGKRNIRKWGLTQAVPTLTLNNQVYDSTAFIVVSMECLTPTFVCLVDWEMAYTSDGFNASLTIISTPSPDVIALTKQPWFIPAVIIIVLFFGIILLYYLWTRLKACLARRKVKTIKPPTIMIDGLPLNERKAINLVDKSEQPIIISLRPELASSLRPGSAASNRRGSAQPLRLGSRGTQRPGSAASKHPSLSHISTSSSEEVAAFIVEAPQSGDIKTKTAGEEAALRNARLAEFEEEDLQREEENQRLDLQAIQTIEKNRKAAAAAHQVEQEMNQQLIMAAEAELAGGNSNSRLPGESNIPDTFVAAITEKEITTRGAFTFFDDREDPKAMVACLEEPELEWQQDLKAPPGAGEGQQDHCREALQESEVDSGVEDTTPSKEKVKKKKKAKKSKADIEGGATELTEVEEESEKKKKKK